MADDDNPTGRATSREVYQLVDRTRTELASKVDEVRKELVDQLGTLSAGVHLLSTNNEHRLTALEQDNVRHSADLAEHDIRLKDLETAHNRALGHLGAWKLLAGIGGGACTLIIGELVLHWIVG